MFVPALPPLAEVTLMVAVRRPGADGLKLTTYMQVWLGCSEGPQVVDTFTKSAALVPPMVTVTRPLSRLMPPAVAVLLFVMVKVTGAVAPTGVLGNDPSACPMAVSEKHCAAAGPEPKVVCVGTAASSLQPFTSRGPISSTFGCLPVPVSDSVALAPETEVTVNVQVDWVIAPGVYLMDIVQLCVGRSGAEQVLPEITNPLPRALGIVSAPVVAPPVLVMVRVSSPLGVFSEIPSNANGFGTMVRIAGLVAVAVTGRLNGLVPSADAVSRPE